MFTSSARHDARPAATIGHTLVDVLLETAGRHPDATALEADGESLTYRGLVDRARVTAARLHEAGLGTGGRVGICVPSGTTDLYVAILGTLLAGAAYVPVDADDPAERRETVFREAGVAATLGARLALASGPGRTPPTTGLPSYPEPADDAWIIFTSGSTGTPKGVAVSHGSAAAFLRAEQRLWTIRPGDRVMAGLSVSFDASCEEMWSAWANGATLVAAPRATVRDAADLGRWITAHGITVVSSVPSLAALWGDDVLDSLRLVVLGGEALPQELSDRLSAHVETWNTYGPTEATVVTTAARMSPGRPVTIGTALDGWSCAVVDEAGLPVDAGATGELVIAGVGLGRYLDPALDTARFAGLASLGWQRAYRSGDLVRATPDGLVFVGRRDHQVKIGGRRIELGEVDAAARSVAGVTHAVTVVRRTDAGNDLLVSYVAPADVDAELVRRTVADRLSGGLTPLVVPVAALPLTTAGKVDRKGLPWPPPARSDRPLTGTSAQVAAVWREVLGEVPIDAETQFFDVGGTSLASARVVTTLRDRFPVLTVADLYDAPRLADFADRLDAQPSASTAGGASFHMSPGERRRARRSSLAQLVGVLAVLVATAIPWLVDILVVDDIGGDVTVGVTAWVVLAVAWACFATSPGRAFVAFGARRLLLPDVRPGRYSRFGGLALRLWFLDRLSDVFRVDQVAGTPWAGRFARLAGFDIAPDALVATLPHPTANVSVAAGATVEGEVEFQGWYLDGAELVVGPITIGAGARVAQRVSLYPGVTVGEGAEIEAGSVVVSDVPAGERWAGSPARPVGLAGEDFDPPPAPPRGRSLAWLYALGLATDSLFPLVAALPAVLAIAVLGGGLSTSELLSWPVLAATPLVGASYVAALAVLIALALRLANGLLRPGLHPAHGLVGWAGWFAGHLMTQAIAGLFPLFATVFTRRWMRLAGMRIGRGTEVCTSNTLTAMVSVGELSMVTDDVCFATVRSHRGWIDVRPISVGDRSFLGNGALVPGGTVVGDDALVGVQTIPPAVVPDGSSWLGSPAIDLPRPPRDADAARTYHPPTRLRAARVAHELVRIVLPMTVSSVLLDLVYSAVVHVGAPLGIPAMFAILLVALVAAGALATGVTVAGKWLLIGRYRASSHPLWSSFVWRDEIVNSLQEALSGQWLLGAALGTPVISWYLRSLGARVGSNVVVDSLAITEFDMVDLEDWAVVNREACLETHLFHDRVLEIGPTRLARGASLAPRATILPDSSMGSGTHLGMRSVVLRGEHLPPETQWIGNPVRPARRHQPTDTAG